MCNIPTQLLVFLFNMVQLGVLCIRGQKNIGVPMMVAAAGGSKECVGIFGLDSESCTWLSQGLKAALCRFFFLSCLVAAAVAASQSHSTTVVRLCIYNTLLCTCSGPYIYDT